ncbi:MAG TPA: YcxB family protein [Gammaproteobacteria bacterium]|nr:YcxB family protein [Gammaproteobacteria bacterium]
MKFVDYLLFNAVHQFSSVPLQVTYLLLTWLIYAVFDESVGRLGAAILAVMSYLAMWVFHWAFNVIVLYSGKNKALLTDHVVEVQPDSLYEETRFNRSCHYWPGVVKVVRRPGFVAVYVAAHLAHIIPRRAFSSREQVDEFVALVRQRVQASKSSRDAC